MRPSFRPLLVIAAVALAAPAVGGPSPTPDAAGPRLGNVRYRAELRYGPDGYDTDTYSARLARGERLSALVVSPFQSPLFPTLEVIGPDGAVRAVETTARGFGKRIEFEDFEVPETGRWTVRVASILQTQGRYTVQFAVRSAPAAQIRVDPDVSGVTAASADLRFDAVEGSSLELRATASGRSKVSIASLVDPAGAEVQDDGGPAVDGASAKRGGAVLRVDSLATGDGEYRATITAPAGHDGFTARAVVVPPRRARGAKRLVPDEPWIAPLARPLRGVHERSIRVQGAHFPVAPVPTVLFGGVPGDEVFVDPYGTYIDVAPPKLAEGANYPVSVVLADGQAHTRDDYLYYVPTPVGDEIVAADGSPVVGGSTGGGRVVRIRGRNLQTGIFLSFGGSADVIPLILGDDLIEVVTPPHAAGVVEVHILDAYIHDVIVAVPFEYKAPPSFSFAPYTPTTAVAGVPTPIVVAGDRFERTDVIEFDGQPLPTAWISDSRLTFTVPPSASGSHTLRIVDRMGSVVVGPSFVVQ